MRIINNDSPITFDNASLTADIGRLNLYLTPSDWTNFIGLGRNWKQTFDMMIPSHPTNDKLRANFVNDDKNLGFKIHFYENSIQFQGYCRLTDGNSRPMVFNLMYDVSNSVGVPFFDNRHKMEFTYETFDVGTRADNLNAWSEAKIYIDEVEKASYYITNRTEFGDNTQMNGVYLPNEGRYLINLEIPGTKLYEFKIETLKNPSNAGLLA